MLGPRQGLLELLELPLLWVDLVDAPELEGRLLEALGTRLRKLMHARKLLGGIAGLPQRRSVALQSRRRRLSGPGVEHRGVRRHGEQALVLVLAAEVDRGTHLPGQLAHARHAAVNLHAAAATRLHAPAHHVAFIVIRAQVDAPLHKQVVVALADGARVGALAYQELQGTEQGRLTGARLTRQHREAGCGLDGRVADQGDALNVELVNHCFFLMPP